MKKIILLSLLISGCSPMVQPNILISDNKVKVEDKKVIGVNPSVTPTIMQSEKPVELVQTPKPEPTVDININDSLKNINASNSPLPSPTPSVPSSSDPKTFPTDPKYGQGGVIDGSTSGRFGYIDTSEPIPKLQVIGVIDSGYVNLIFKDSYKIRYNKQENKFYSDTGYDTSNINKIIRDFEVKNIVNFLYLYKTQEEADIQEKYYEKGTTRDIPNDASRNRLILLNKDMGLLVTLLRQDECVRASLTNIGIPPSAN
jgi:hypothetical protein